MLVPLPEVGDVPRVLSCVLQLSISPGNNGPQTKGPWQPKELVWEGGGVPGWCHMLVRLPKNILPAKEKTFFPPNPRPALLTLQYNKDYLLASDFKWITHN